MSWKESAPSWPGLTLGCRPASQPVVHTAKAQSWPHPPQLICRHQVSTLLLQESRGPPVPGPESRSETPATLRASLCEDKHGHRLIPGSMDSNPQQTPPATPVRTVVSPTCLWLKHSNYHNELIPGTKWWQLQFFTLKKNLTKCAGMFIWISPSNLPFKKMLGGNIYNAWQFHCQDKETS